MDLVEAHKLLTKFDGLVIQHEYSVQVPDKPWKKRQSIERWTRKREIGRGGFSTVWLEENTVGSVRAVKLVHKSFTQGQGVDYLRELSALAWFSRVWSIEWYMLFHHI